MESELTTAAEKEKKRPSSTINRHLLLFALLFGSAMVSGFYFYFVPNTHNWKASQIVLVIHFIVGLLTFIPFGYFVVKHQRKKEGNSLFLVMPWKAFKKKENESTWHYRQRLWGHALYWSIVIVLLSSFFVSIPAALYYMGKIYLPGYILYQISNAIHLIFSVIAGVLIVVHLMRRKNKRG
ncbi:MAG: cytochrome b/b6 domain-containing protein [Chloroflexi bacterium]|nr:cytochrome b/b6 domain-containing protein [Chloroflexota bacterium]